MIKTSAKVKLDLQDIDSIIFDLGMVIIDLEMEDTTTAFKKIFGGSYEEVIEKLNSTQHFEKYETGKISSNEFINEIAKLAAEDIRGAIPEAWNAMLKDIPDVRFNILKRAKRNYRTFCLSNTNELHIEWIYDYLRREKKLDSLDPFFEKVYLSHEIGMRKPNTEIFEYVLKENGLIAEKTLFIDDTLGHLKGAEKCGIRTFHLSEGVKLEDLLPS